MAAKDSDPHSRPLAGEAPYNEEELDEVRAALLERLERLTASQAAQLGSLGGDKHHLADLEEMGDSSDADSTCEIIDLSASTIEKIDRALEKIDEGTYGICESCGHGIRRVRLRALPFATLCVECQRQLEEEAERGRAFADRTRSAED